MITMVKGFLILGIAGYLMRKSLLGKTVGLSFKITKEVLLLNYNLLEKTYKYLNSKTNKVTTAKNEEPLKTTRKVVNGSSSNVIYLRNEQ